MKIKVYSAYTVRKTEDKEHLISVRTPVADFTPQYQVIDNDIAPTFDSSLIIFCDDITREEEGYKLFDSTQAQQIIDYVADIGEDACIAIHCSAGMSRSVAIGAFFRDYFGADVTFTVTGHDDFRNIHIYNVLRREFFKLAYDRSQLEVDYNS